MQYDISFHELCATMDMEEFYSADITRPIKIPNSNEHSGKDVC
jgi:hypothetical protein